MVIYNDTIWVGNKAHTSNAAWYPGAIGTTFWINSGTKVDDGQKVSMVSKQTSNLITLTYMQTADGIHIPNGEGHYVIQNLLGQKISSGELIEGMALLPETAGIWIFKTRLKGGQDLIFRVTTE